MNAPGVRKRRTIWCAVFVPLALVCGPQAAADRDADSVRQFLDLVDALSGDPAQFQSLLEQVTPVRVSPGDGLFLSHVAPILREACIECHAPGRVRGGLDLATRETLLAGGDSGPAIIPGDSANSTLMKLIRHEEQPAMPHKQDPLTPDAIAAIAAWIDAGAPYHGPLVDVPADHTGELQVTDNDRNFWSFRPLADVTPPVPAHTDWARTPIDQFVRARLDEAGIAPNGEATRATLIRRASMSLTGLPPAPAEVDAFVNDPDPRAWEHLIDSLLASPHYGERWGRHWLDVARYADSGGYEFDVERPHAYPYRDFVIRAINDDMPYDQFVKWQIAGDEYAPDEPWAIAATGFLTAGPTISNQETEKNFYDELDDMLSTTGSAVLGLTVSCARCHDHKYDAIPQRDYYRMLSAFSTMTRGDRYMVPRNEARAYRETHAAWEKRLEEAKNRLQAFLEPLREPIRNAKIDALAISDIEKTLLRAPRDRGNEDQRALFERFRDAIRVSDDELREHGDIEAFAHWDTLRADIDRIEKDRPKEPPKVYALTDKQPNPEVSYFLDRGEPHLKSDTVTLGYLSVLPGYDSPRFTDAVFKPAHAETTFRRTALAEWLMDVEHGAGRLSARVIANRLWHYHFGAGLVRTPSDFGIQGDRPSHPELLDWLARELIDNGWSMKHLHRVIMNSAVYRLDGAFDEAKAAVDPDNRLLWRRKPVRLESEIIRDSMLAVAGVLNDTMYGPGVFPFVHPDAIATGSTPKWPVDAQDGPDTWRRSVYIFLRRSARMPMMETFDQPDTTLSCARRTATTIPSQALALMNSHFVIDQARHFAARLETECGPDATSRIHRGFQLALGRTPTDSEYAAAQSFLAAQARLYPDGDAARKALEDFCQVLLGLNEFVYID